MKRPAAAASVTITAAVLGACCEFIAANNISAHAGPSGEITGGFGWILGGSVGTVVRFFD